MSGNKRSRENDLNPDQAPKKLKISNTDINNELVPSLLALNDDILDNLITNYLGVSSLLSLAMTCSKLNNLVGSQYKRIMRRIFPCRLDTTDEIREQIQEELKDIAKIERAFNHNVRVVEIDEDRKRNNERPIFRSFPGDPTKLMCVTNANSYSLVQIVDLEQGNIYSVQLSNFSTSDVAFSADCRVAFLGNQRTEVQIYSVLNPAHWTKVGVFKSDKQYDKIARMSLAGYWIIYQPFMGNYVIFNDKCEVIKVVQYNDNQWRQLAVSEDGSDAVQLVYRPYKHGKLDRVNLLTNESTCLLDDTEDAADNFTDLKFMTGTDWVAWQRMGTEKFALFMYNLKTGERYWTPTSSGPKLSYGGTMILSANHSGGLNSLNVQDLYSEQQLQIGPFGEDCTIFNAKWTYLLDNTGDMTERLIANLYGDDSTCIGVIDPRSGELLADVYSGDDNVSWTLYQVLANGRTLVFTDKYERFSEYYMVWNLY